LEKIGSLQSKKSAPYRPISDSVTRVNDSTRATTFGDSDSIGVMLSKMVTRLDSCHVFNRITRLESQSMTLIRVVKVFLRRFRDPIRVLQIGSLASEKIIIGSLKSENIGSLESEKSGPYRSKPLSNEIFDLTPCTPCTLHRVIFYTPNTRAVVVSRDRNLRDRDRNLVKISGWDRDWDFIKNSDTETWSSRPRLETSKLVHFAEIFLKNIAITSKSFFLFLAFSQHVLVVSYLKIQITKNSW